MGKWLVLVLAATSVLCAQDEDFHVFRDPPRIFLNAQRLKRVQRETTRESIRWRQFSTLAESQAQFPEPGFAWALHYAATGNAASAKTAIEWAMQPGATDIRQLALVYDWCQKAMSPAQKSAIGAKLLKVVNAAPGSGKGAAGIRDQVLAAIAIADEAAEPAEKVIRYTVEEWWRKSIAPALREGKPAISREELAPLFEVLHAVFDNTKVDLRDGAPQFFKDIPSWHLLSHYPAPLQTADNEFRIPAFVGTGEPDLKVAALSRAADLMIVAYDPNAVEAQFLQGYLIQDRFLMRGLFGLPYEFLWANPYQPGLPFAKMDPFFHDATGGRFFVRSSWEEDATWFGFFDGAMQLSTGTEIRNLKPGALKEPVEIGGATILQAASADGMKFPIDLPEGGVFFILGFPPKAVFDVETDEEEMFEAEADASGILLLEFAKGAKGQVWIHRPGRGVLP
ncbi:hypothetical protein F183_A51320 [Bryobacterales bacterium F-183]|nr:hypothetical protein F183_A51320 [Bryobacterales bacterium F-183]